jgi:hypothetical protein
MKVQQKRARGILPAIAPWFFLPFGRGPLLLGSALILNFFQIRRPQLPPTDHRRVRQTRWQGAGSVR